MRRTTLGWLMAIVAALIILYNVTQTADNERQIRDHPWATFFSDGANLKPAYTFMPPYTGFESVVVAVAAIGVVLIFMGNPPRPPSDSR